jgi:hypothetical protein
MSMGVVADWSLFLLGIVGGSGDHSGFVGSFSAGDLHYLRGVI